MQYQIDSYKKYNGIDLMQKDDGEMPKSFS